MLELTVYGIVFGSIISLGAIGLTLVFGIIRFANFAHGDLMSSGAYVALFMVTGILAWIGVPDTNFGMLSFSTSPKNRKVRWIFSPTTHFTFCRPLICCKVSNWPCRNLLAALLGYTAKNKRLVFVATGILLSISAVLFLGVSSKMVVYTTIFELSRAREPLIKSADCCR